MSTIGQGIACYVLDIASVANTVARVSTVTWLQHARICSYVLSAGGTLDGAWTIEVSNDYSGAGGSAMGQAPTAGTWIDVTTGFKKLDGTALAAVVHSTASANQYVQAAPVGARAVRVTFTATTGTGAVRAAVAGGEY